MDQIVIRGAAEHNLKNVSVDIPRDSLTVFTGVSGSGKSSLAFDTIYKEGQRRFLESLSAYARQFLGGFDKPKVDILEGLSPTISIDQKTVGRSPRSTVGTITEVHDHLRLFYSRLGEPHCPSCGQQVQPQSAERIVDQALARFAERPALILAPVVRGRKGEYRQLLEQLVEDGHARARINGELVRLGSQLPALKRHEKHTIEVVCDRLVAVPTLRSRWQEAVEKALALAEGIVCVAAFHEGAAGEEARAGEEALYSSRLACPSCGLSLPEIEPRLFSFNSPQGACPACDGLGETDQIDPELVVLDPSAPLGKGALAGMLPDGGFIDEELDGKGLQSTLKKFGATLRSSWGDLNEAARRAVLEGHGEFRGLVPAMTAIAAQDPGGWISRYVQRRHCKECQGSRLCAVARAVTFAGKGLQELGAMAVRDLAIWLKALRLQGNTALVGEPILKNVLARLHYLENVGLSYLTLSRRSDTLAGGEAQRLRLASQVGAGLQGVLFVLDEPSIGLHPRDNRALLATLLDLRDLGNTVLVVEHDLATMEIADHLVDVGPGAGSSGGEIVAVGSVQDLAGVKESVTGNYFSGARSIEIPGDRRRPGSQWLELRKVGHNNLKDIDVRIPLGLLVVVTGVSGSGKSSLVNHVLRPAVLNKLGFHTQRPGRHRALLGYQHIDKLVDIDQSAIGRTPRSNPATYVKLFDSIRDLFAQVPEARTRGYKPGRFSFNKDGGRCLECCGAGVTTVEMQFLPAVEVVCDACEGKRYNRETLEVHYRGKSIYDVLEMPIAAAMELFADHPQLCRPLAMLDKVGLGYMRLGQPSTTLSGGEAQRVKLASELKKRDTGKTLYLLDEPTTGLHFEDIRVLLMALQELVQRGNTVLVIEHSTDVMKVADWIIDLGPEAGDAGGQLVAAGTPEEISGVAESHTGIALREVLSRKATTSQPVVSRRAPRPQPRSRDIEVFGARQHNLKGIDVRIPSGAITVITGVSGSGKTSLAFDTIFAEGQRRYLESLSTYARRFLGRMQGVECDRVTGLSPAIAIDQKSASSNPRSTVATITEIHDYLRLLYARVGRPHCVTCGAALTWTSPTRLAQELSTSHGGEKAMVLSPLRVQDHEVPDARGRGFDQRVEALRASLLKDGFTRVLAGGQEARLDEAGDACLRRMMQAARESSLHLVVDRVVLGEGSQSRLAQSLEQAFERGLGKVAVAVGDQAPITHTRVPSCPQGHMTLEGELTPSMFSFSSHHGACPRCKGLGLENRVDPRRIFRNEEAPVFSAMDAGLFRFINMYRTSTLRVLERLLELASVRPQTPFKNLESTTRETILFGCPGNKVPLNLKDGTVIEAHWPGLVRQLEDWSNDGSLGPLSGFLVDLFEPQRCSVCGGGRLRPESLQVRVGGVNIQELAAFTVTGVRSFVASLELLEREQLIARQVLVEISNRLRFLDEVGLGYLTLDRTAGTLSGGEAQRIRLASQLGNRLAGVLYVLDEPTVGLHPRDTRKLIASLEGLRDLGNTVLLVEHDRDTMKAAQWIIDIGPEAGVRGGNVLAQGRPEQVWNDPSSLTGKYLRGERRVWDGATARRQPTGWLKLVGACQNNLRGIDVEFPLGVLTVVTGVSGSGKSSLVLDVLAEVVSASIVRTSPAPGLIAASSGLESIRRLVVVDQKPIGRTPRSNPATYSGLWDLVRQLYEQMPAAKVRGFTASRFSFNTGEGRCLACDGQGAVQVEMHFLSDVWVPCDECKGKRFERETLAILFKDKNVGDVLAMDVSEALAHFESQPRIRRILGALEAVGLGYLKLGQAADTLSGGEAQRLKLAAELVSREGGGTLYVLDEPTTGLHFEDVRRLLAVFDALLVGGNSLVVIEHHLDVIRAGDWVIDLGPEAGDAGGRIVACGPPEVIAACAGSHTGAALGELS